MALALALVLAGAACGGGGAGSAAQTGSAPRFAGSVWPGQTAAPDFALHDQDGNLVTLAGQRGRFTVVTFLYVHCKDVCPIIASQLNDALRRLGPARTDVRVLAVSVDPKGDTPKAVRRFVRSHRLLPQFRYLTGKRTELEPIWSAYHVAVDPSDLDSVDHSAYELVVDRTGHGRLSYDADVKAGHVVHDLRALGLGQSAGPE